LSADASGIGYTFKGEAKQNYSCCELVHFDR
jgi:hypothetical protein